MVKAMFHIQGNRIYCMYPNIWEGVSPYNHAQSKTHCVCIFLKTEDYEVAVLYAWLDYTQVNGMVM